MSTGTPRSYPVLCALYPTGTFTITNRTIPIKVNREERDFLLPRGKRFLTATTLFFISRWETMNSNFSLSPNLRSPLFHYPPAVVALLVLTLAIDLSLSRSNGHCFSGPSLHVFLLFLQVKLSCTCGGLEAFSSFNAVTLQRTMSISPFVSPAIIEFLVLFSIATQIPFNAFAESATSHDAFAGKGDSPPSQPQIKVNLESSSETNIDLESLLIGLMVVTLLFVIFSPVLVPTTITISLVVMGFLVVGALKLAALLSILVTKVLVWDGRDNR
uniref:Uncharacterized protein n=1 Tax=Nelumbo nucifera TaxID=4432 RepID=A0A822YWL7_NELNU|nr:TPA_asm: hypothetical protein HUJ06_007578 [Nelumbo nucifera]